MNMAQPDDDGKHDADGRMRKPRVKKLYPLFKSLNEGDQQNE